MKASTFQFLKSAAFDTLNTSNLTSKNSTGEDSCQAIFQLFYCSWIRQAVSCETTAAKTHKSFVFNGLWKVENFVENEMGANRKRLTRLGGGRAFYLKVLNNNIIMLAWCMLCRLVMLDACM